LYTKVRKICKFKKRLKRPELGMTLFGLTSLRLGSLCSYFPGTLSALMIFLFLANTGIRGMMELKTLSLTTKARTLLRGWLSYFQLAPDGAEGDFSPPNLKETVQRDLFG
jgi:hypothetical protein